MTFRTGSSADAAPFRMTDASPPDGAAVGGTAPTVVLTFSKPVNAASLTGSAVIAYSSGRAMQVTLSRTNNDRSIGVSLPPGPGDVTLVLDPDVTDLAGNALAAFEARYHVSASAAAGLSNYLREMRPRSGATGVPASTSITWFLTTPVALPAVQSSLRVIANGAPVPGSFSVSPDGLILQFLPKSSFPSGATVRFYQSSAVFADNYGAYFTIATKAPSYTEVLRYIPAGDAPANSVIEVEFAGPVATGKGLIKLHSGLYAVGPE